MGLKLSEERKGYYRVDRVHPVTGGRMVRKGADQLLLLQWARVVDEVRDKYQLGLISREDACRALLVSEEKRYTVKDAWEAWFPTLTHPGTRRAYAAAWDQRLKEHFGAMALDSLTDQVLTEWATKQAKTNTQKGRPPSPKTISNAWEALKGAVKFELGRKLDRLPWRKFTVKIKKHKNLPTEREALRSFEEMERLIRGAAEEDARVLGTVSGVKYADLAPRVGLLLLSGVRAGECAALGFDDYVERAGVPHLNVRHQVINGWRKRNPDWTRPQDPPKNGAALIPVHPDVVALIEYQKAQLMALGWYRDDGPIFPGKNGQWREKSKIVDPARMRQIVKKYVPEADWKAFVTHSTRHSFATVVSVALQGDEKRAMALTRHADADTFRGYMHMGGRGLVENPLPRTNLGLPEISKQLPPHEYPRPDTWTPEDESGDIVDTILNAGIASIVAVTPERARAFEAKKDADRREAQNAIKSRYKASNATDFDTAWKQWTAAGRPGERPFQVTAAMTHAYDRTRKDVQRRGLNGRRNVQKNERTWETIARHNLGIPLEKAVPDSLINELRALNDNRDKPPSAGNCYTIPADWEAKKRARASRRAALMAWEAYRKKRDGEALRSGECTDEPDGKIRFVDGRKDKE